MIYFDKNKQAYAFEIPDYICKISDEVWCFYAGTDKWDIINGEFIDISETEEYKKAQEEKEHECRNQEIDEKIKELQIMAIPEILNGNIENIKIYNDVIAGLENARP